MKRMNRHDILGDLSSKWGESGKRHLYLVMGLCAQLDAFERDLIANAKTPDRKPLRQPISINKAILARLSDEDLNKLDSGEAKYPTMVHDRIKKEFEALLTDALEEQNIAILRDMEMLFAFNIDLAILRLIATNGKHVVLLLPGHRVGDRIILFHEAEGKFERRLPTNLVMENHIWEIDHDR
jgi:hypothetical protein